MKTAFIGTPKFSISSIEAIHNSRHSIEFVMTADDKPRGRGMKLSPTPIKQWALDHGIRVVQPGKLRKEEHLELFKNIDAGVVVASVFFIPKWLLKVPQHGFINMHPSLLPLYRGPAPAAFALLNGDKETGVSIIRLTSKMDAGPIIIQEETEITPIEYRPVLEERLSKMGAKMLVKALDQLEQNKATLTEQDHNKATYSKLLSREDGLIDFSGSAQKVNDLIRAMTPWPGAFTYLDGKLVKITAAKVFSHEPTGKEPGMVYKADKEDLFIACGQGTLEVLRLQMMNKRECEHWAFVCGYNIEGKVLGK